MVLPRIAFLDIGPEPFPAQQFCEVAPYGIAFIRQLKGEPKRELVVFGIGMAQEQHVAPERAILSRR